MSITMSQNLLWRYALIFYVLCLAEQAGGSPTFSHSQAEVQPQPSKKLLGRSESAAELFKTQFKNPSDLLAVLLIIGGDIIQKAIAQLAGETVTPVAFSFGWVAYAFNALMPAFGDGTFMPRPDYPGTVITIASRERRKNQSWIIGRLIRDLELEVDRHLATWKDEHGQKTKVTSAGDSGLLITVYQAYPGVNDSYGPKKPKRDKLWNSFFIIVPIQLVISAVPIIVHRNWSIILITVAGSVLALITGSLPELRAEKFKCRIGSTQSYAITRGNGHKHVFLILADRTDGNASGLHLDDLAGAVQHAHRGTRIASVILAILWIFFLITVGGLHVDTWYLMGVGALGMAHNVAVAGLRRASASHGIPLRRIQPGGEFGRKVQPNKEFIGPADPRRPKAMSTLLEVEDEYPGVGISLRDLFFTGVLRGDEPALWKYREDTLGNRRKDWKKRFYPQPQMEKPPEEKSFEVTHGSVNDQLQQQGQGPESTPGAEPERRPVFNRAATLKSQQVADL